MADYKQHDQGGAALTDAVNRPLFLGQSALDLVWGLAFLAVLIDLVTSVIGSGGVFSGVGMDGQPASVTAKIMGLEACLLLLSGSMVLVGNWKLEKLLNTVFHMIMFGTLFLILKGFSSDLSALTGALKRGAESTSANISQTFSYNANVAQPDNCKWFNTAKNKWLAGDPNDETTQAGWCNKTRHADCVCK